MTLRGIEVKRLIVYRFAGLLNDITVKPPLEESQIYYRTVTSSNLDDILSTREKGVHEEFVKFFSEGEQGYYVYYENRVVSCGWVFLNSGQSAVRKKYMLVPSGYAWLHNFWTHPNLRGHGLYSSLLAHICREMISTERVKHPNRIIIDTAQDNIPSNKAIIKANFERIGEIVALRIYKKWLVLEETYGKKIYR